MGSGSSLKARCAYGVRNYQRSTSPGPCADIEIPFAMRATLRKILIRILQSSKPILVTSETGIP